MTQIPGTIGYVLPVIGVVYGIMPIDSRGSQRAGGLSCSNNVSIRNEALILFASVQCCLGFFFLFYSEAANKANQYLSNWICRSMFLSFLVLLKNKINHQTQGNICTVWAFRLRCPRQTPAIPATVHWGAEKAWRCEDGATAWALINLIYHEVVEELVQLVLVNFH